MGERSATANQACQPEHGNTSRQGNKTAHAQGFTRHLPGQLHQTARLIGKKRIQKALGNECAAEDQEYNFKYRHHDADPLQRSRACPTVL